MCVCCLRVLCSVWWHHKTEFDIEFLLNVITWIIILMLPQVRIKLVSILIHNAHTSYWVNTLMSLSHFNVCDVWAIIWFILLLEYILFCDFLLFGIPRGHELVTNDDNFKHKKPVSFQIVQNCWVNVGPLKEDRLHQAFQARNVFLLFFLSNGVHRSICKKCIVTWRALCRSFQIMSTFTAR